MPDRLLVVFFYAHPVGHAIEALHYANGHAAADPALEVSVALNAATPVELARFVPSVRAAYPVDHPFVAPGDGSADALAGIPRGWTWIADDARRHQPVQLELFAGLRDLYAASDAYFTAERRRGVAGFPPLPYRPATAAAPRAARAPATRRRPSGSSTGSTTSPSAPSSPTRSASPASASSPPRTSPPTRTGRAPPA